MAAQIWKWLKSMATRVRSRVMSFSVSQNWSSRWTLKVPVELVLRKRAKRRWALRISWGVVGARRIGRFIWSYRRVISLRRMAGCCSKCWQSCRAWALWLCRVQDSRFWRRMLMAVNSKMQQRDRRLSICSPAQNVESNISTCRGISSVWNRRCNCVRH